MVLSVSLLVRVFIGIITAGPVFFTILIEAAVVLRSIVFAAGRLVVRVIGINRIVI